MSKIKRKEMVESINDHERRINRFERLLKQNGFGFDLPELPKAGDFFEIIQHHSQKLPKGKVLEVAKINHNTNQIKFVGGFNGYFTDFDRSVYLGGAEDEPMKPCTKPKEPEPKLKQLDQSVFDGLDEKWRWAAVNEDGFAGLFKDRPYVRTNEWAASYTLHKNLGGKFDTTNWKNSLIERSDIAKELLEVDLSSELKGSDLCRKMLERGDKFVLCFMSYSNDATAEFHERAEIVLSHDDKGFYVHDEYWQYAVPINNQGEPLTAADVGL